LLFIFIPSNRRHQTARLIELQKVDD